MTVSIVRGGASNDSNGGYQQILSAEQEPQVGLTFGVWRLEPGRAATLVARDSEIAALVFSGSGSLAVNGRVIDFDRREWLETAPTVVHCCAGDSIEAASRGDQTAEVFVVQAPNPNRFAPRFYRAGDVQIEHRGQGILQDTCHRIVRLVFDDTNGPPESKLVLGEVVNFAGRWSSYPPHSHPQPEIYYYRFSPSNGYGHGELGDDVFKIQSGDLLAITKNRSHCQVSAPGYNMYYLWAVRHLDGNRYRGFEFDPQHAWTLNQK